MSSIINYAKKVVVPSQKLQQKKKRIANKVCDLVSQNMKKYPIVGFEIGGSYAKGTWLPETVSYTHLTLPTIYSV